jgi:cytoskeletal protein RodZ
MNQENEVQEVKILENEIQEKKAKKKKNQNGPGHLKERNHFDGKDMILLVVMLIIIYGIMTWVEFFAQEKMNSQEQNQTQTSQTMEINQSIETDQSVESNQPIEGETNQTMTTVENP